MNKKAASRRPKIAPDLQAVLHAQATEQQPIAVVYQLKRSKGVMPAPERVERLVEKIMAKAGRISSTREHRRNVFRHMGSFVVLGDTQLHRALLQQPEIAAAVLNSRPSHPAI